MAGTRADEKKTLAAAHRALRPDGTINKSELARLLKITHSSAHCRLRTLEKEGKWPPKAAAPAPAAKPPPQAAPSLPAAPASTRVVVMTAAQDDTPVHGDALRALTAYCGLRKADLFVGGFTYQHGLFEDHRVETGRFAREIEPYLRPDVVELAPRLVWHGRANILPTATDPLSGWETKTRDAWAVFPHARIALKSVPRVARAPSKQIMTTGVITRANYVQRNAGQKAEFHHTIGAVVAEIDPDGVFFCRHIQVDRDGSVHDLDLIVEADGRRRPFAGVEAVTWGDLHFEMLDPAKARASWGWPEGDGCMLDTLKPRYQFFHDSFDFRRQSPHTRNDPHERQRLRTAAEPDVDTMLRRLGEFIARTRRPWCRSVHVASNHNIHLDKWLKDTSIAGDPAHAILWHELNHAWHKALRDGDLEFNPHAHAIKTRAVDLLDDVTFLREGESFQICQGAQAVECGLHGHAGPSGARGSLTSLARIVERVNIGHSHAPGIREGAYQAGTSSLLEMGYNDGGPGPWDQSDIVTYPNSKRAIVTLAGGRWRGRA